MDPRDEIIQKLHCKLDRSTKKLEEMKEKLKEQECLLKNQAALLSTSFKIMEKRKARKS